MEINQRVIHLIFAVVFLIINLYGIPYELKRGKKWILEPKTRAFLYFVISCQWFVAILIILFYPEDIIFCEGKSIVYDLFVWPMVFVPLFLILIEGIVYRVITKKN